MIYSGYEQGHFYVRLSEDMKLADAMCILLDGYKIVRGNPLFIKRREYPSIRQPEA